MEITGRLSANAWSNADGEAKASLNFHANNIKLHGVNKAAVAQPANAEKETEDLPF